MTLTLIRDGEVDWCSVQVLGSVFMLLGSSLISLSKVMLKEVTISETINGGDHSTTKGGSHRSLADDYFSR